jgi:hypothetical protein
MAKVRLQARNVEEDDSEAIKAAEEGHGKTFANVVAEGSKPKPTRIPRYTGAIDVLRKVLQQQGMLGWYQVSPAEACFCALIDCITTQSREWGRKSRRLFSLRHCFS